MDEDMQYAVFVSYVEIYNKYTCDLLVTITNLTCWKILTSFDPFRF